MTRQDFIDNINDFDELIDFCNDYECSYCDDVYSEESRDDYINEDLVDMARYTDSWYSLLNTLYNITTGYDYYRHTDYGDWEGLGDYEFNAYKNDVLEWADDQDIWEDDEEEPLPEDDEDEDDDFVADEPISIGELMGVCNSQLRQIGVDKKVNEAADDEAFEVFVAGCATIVEGE